MIIRIKGLLLLPCSKHCADEDTDEVTNGQPSARDPDIRARDVWGYQNIPALEDRAGESVGPDSLALADLRFLGGAPRDDVLCLDRLSLPRPFNPVENVEHRPICDEYKKSENYVNFQKNM